MKLEKRSFSSLRGPLMVGRNEINDNQKIVDGEGNGTPLQYSCLENLMDREAWWATGHRGRKESGMTE